MTAPKEKDNVLKAVPFRNTAMKVESFDDCALVSIPLNRPWWARRPLTYIFPISEFRRVQLDAIGTWVLNQCDGRRSVEDLVEAMMDKHRLSFHEARHAVLQFMKMLSERGIVALASKGRAT